MSPRTTVKITVGCRTEVIGLARHAVRRVLLEGAGHVRINFTSEFA